MTRIERILEKIEYCKKIKDYKWLMYFECQLEVLKWEGK